MLLLVFIKYVHHFSGTIVLVSGIQGLEKVCSRLTNFGFKALSHRFQLHELYGLFLSVGCVGFTEQSWTPLGLSHDKSESNGKKIIGFLS